MLDDDHTFRDFNNAEFNSIATTLTDNDWSATFKQQPADISASILKESIHDPIHQFFPFKPFRRSTFPTRVSSKLKYPLFKTKLAH